MSPIPDEKGLARRFDRAVVEHFGSAEQADAEAVMVTGRTVVASHIAGVREPVTRGVLLAQAQWVLRRVVAGMVRAKQGGGRPHGT